MGRILVVHLQMTYESLPTSACLSASAGRVFDLMPFGSVSSSAEESAVLRRLSTGEDTDELLRLLLPAGAYLCKERRLLRSLCLGGVGLLLTGAGAGLSCSLPRLRLELRLRRRS